MGLTSTMRMYGRFVSGLPAYLRRPRMTLEDARATLRRALAEREKNFLYLARHAVYGNPRSPYRALLGMAGCTFGDLEGSVRDKGLEPTLQDLREAGVYVTFEEYKGRMPLARGSTTIEVGEHDFDNPLTSKAFEGRTGGTTGVGTRVGTDLDNLWAQAPQLMYVRHVHGLLGFPMAVWKGELPDPTGIGVYLMAVPYRHHPERWFTPVTRDYYAPPLRFRMATRYVVWMSRLCGLPCPPPEPLPLERALVLARWAADAVREHGGCEVVATISLAMRVCLAAEEAGIDLTGVAFLGGGEPFTAAKNAVVQRVGARFVALYISEDAGPMGMPCAHPVEENDQHLLEDGLALIQHPREVLGSGVYVDAFLFTSLRPFASKVLLNMESDDYGVVERRSCGCAYEELGYATHLRQIRSFGKLTGEGVTLVGSEMVRILEEELPRRLGGGPQHYQLLEEDDEQGLARLTILVHPDVEAGSDQGIIEAMLQSIGASSDAGGLASSFWQQADTFRVRRQPPIYTARGKLVPIRVAAIHDPPGVADEGSGE
ncbi:MAG: hypothetical protein PVJ49_07480 [Acidobacteriota bacterium]|jgi:hypothetical protein